MVTISFLNYSGLPQVISKSYVNMLDLSGTFRQPLSLMNPTITVEGVNIQTLLNENRVNYVKIEDKYYYITDWNIMPNEMVNVELHLDALMTYKDEINKLSIILDRGKGEGDTKDVTDSQYPVSNKKTYEIMNLPTGFDDRESHGTYIVVTSQDGYRLGLGDD